MRVKCQRTVLTDGYVTVRIDENSPSRISLSFAGGLPACVAALDGPEIIITALLAGMALLPIHTDMAA